MMSVHKRVVAKSPVRENRTQGSEGGSSSEEPCARKPHAGIRGRGAG